MSINHPPSGGGKGASMIPPLSPIATIAKDVARYLDHPPLTIEEFRISDNRNNFWLRFNTEGYTYNSYDVRLRQTLVWYEQQYQDNYSLLVGLSNGIDAAKREQHIQEYYDAYQALYEKLQENYKIENPNELLLK